MNKLSPGFIERFLSNELKNNDLVFANNRMDSLLLDIISKITDTADQPNVNKIIKTRSKKVIEGFQSISKKKQYSSHTLSSLKFMVTAMYSLVAIPEIVIPCGYDEVRYSGPEIIDPTLSADMQGIIDDMISGLDEYIDKNSDEDQLLIKATSILYKGTQYRSPDGVWHTCEGVIDKFIPDQSSGDQKTGSYWMDLFRTTWYSKYQKADEEQKSLIYMPTLAFITHSLEDIPLKTATQKILYELAMNKKDLSSIDWRTLEEIVAELLKDSGLEIILTPRSKDGGRDVIARGELIPGEPSILAVEVKHKKLVDIGDLSAALYRNRHFPALLFATSGRFSTGVYKERRNQDNMMRLYLKDGVALTQLINQYAKRNKMFWNS